jgi:hypothetical protein
LVEVIGPVVNVSGGHVIDFASVVAAVPSSSCDTVTIVDRWLAELRSSASRLAQLPPLSPTAACDQGSS